MASLNVNDGGYKSRKYTSYVLTSLLILIAGWLMGADKLPQIVFGLVSCLAVYNGANVGRDFVVSKSITPLPTPPKTDKPNTDEAP